MEFRAVRDSRGITYVSPLGTPWKHYGEVATHVCMWHNRWERAWVVSFSNAQGEQIGSSEYVYSKDDAIDSAVRLFNEAWERGRCECAVSRVYGGDCAHTAPETFE